MDWNLQGPQKCSRPRIMWHRASSKTQWSLTGVIARPKEWLRTDRNITQQWTPCACHGTKNQFRLNTLRGTYTKTTLLITKRYHKQPCSFPMGVPPVIQAPARTALPLLPVSPGHWTFWARVLAYIPHQNFPSTWQSTHHQGILHAFCHSSKHKKTHWDWQL